MQPVKAHTSTGKVANTAQARRKRHAARTVVLALTALVSVLLLAAGEILAEDRKQVLVLNSYSPGYKWTDDIVEGLRTAVAESGREVSLQIEYMGARIASGPEFNRLLFELLRHKYRKTRFDVIVSADNDALDFLLEYRDRLFPDTPVIFCGVNQYDPSQLGGARLFTGVNEFANIASTLDLALKLHPNTRKIVIINDTTTTGIALHRRIVELLPKYRARFEVDLLEGETMPEILAILRALPPDSIVYYTFLFKDGAGRLFEFDESVRLITGAAPVPVYAGWDFNLGYGVVGGKMLCGKSQGQTAGEMAMHVLAGEDVSRIPVKMESPSRYMFDYRQLERFGISLSDLPEGSDVINRPLDFYRVHRPTIWLMAAAVVGLSFGVLLLLRNASIKRDSERKLRQLAQELEERVRERTVELIESQTELENQNRELQSTYQELKDESETRIGMMEELRLKDQMLLQQSRMAAMGEMLGNIAHQWRQPLNLVGLKIQEIGLSYKLGKFSEELLNANVAKAMEILQHMSKTIDDLRMLSTPDKKKVPFMLDEVIAKTMSLIGDSLTSKGISIESEVEADLQVEGFPNEFAQALLNLLMNARDALLERGVEDGWIRLRGFRHEGKSQVVVADNAGGIPEEIIDKIFDPYFTTKDIGKGTGIGLFMSKTIIEKNMGGSLTVRNTAEGAEFRITV